MRRKRPAGEVRAPLPHLAPGLTREQWLAAMRAGWADKHVPGTDRWARAQAALGQIEAFELSGAEAKRCIEWARL